MTGVQTCALPICLMSLIFNLDLLFDSGFDVVAGFDVFNIQSGFAL